MQLSGAGTVSRECLLSEESGSAFCDGRTLAGTLTVLLSIHVLKFSPIFEIAYLHVPNANHCTLGTGCSKTDHKNHIWGNISIRSFKGRETKHLKSLPVDGSWFRVESEVTVGGVVASSNELVYFKTCTIYAP